MTNKQEENIQKLIDNKIVYVRCQTIEEFKHMQELFGVIPYNFESNCGFRFYNPDEKKYIEKIGFVRNFTTSKEILMKDIDSILKDISVDDVFKKIEGIINE